MLSVAEAERKQRQTCMLNSDQKLNLSNNSTGRYFKLKKYLLLSYIFLRNLTEI